MDGHRYNVCVRTKDLLDNVNLNNPDTFFFFIKRTDAYIVNVHACKL